MSHRYTSKQKEDAINARKSGMTYAEVIQLTGMKRGAVWFWMHQEDKSSKQLELKKQVEYIPERPPEKNQANYRMTLDEFISMLKLMLTDYEHTKVRLHTLERKVEEWKRIAGNLTDQLNRGG